MSSSATGECRPSLNEPNGPESTKSDPATPNGVKSHQPNTGPSTNPVSAGLETVFLYVPFEFIGFLIGHRAKNIRRIVKFSGASLVLCAETRHCPEMDNIFQTQDWRKLKITGSYIAIKNAQHMIFTQLDNKFLNFDPAIYGNFQLVVEIFVPSNQIGHIIGRNGWKVNRLELMTGSKIQVSAHECVNGTSPVFIIGDFKSTQMAQKKIHWLLQETKSNSTK